ncbi:MAG TPA: hypothetical protein VFS66_11290 [Acidimicrobiia bacterium]|nr:hypothetical protein [Acidimicrobiia bacterium]
MADITVAASEDAFREFFAHVRDEFAFAQSDSADLGPFVAGYSIDIRLEDGTVDLRNDNTISISELDIDPVVFSGFIGVDIPEICIGGFCILPSPWGCVIRAPRICVFDDNPDISLSLDLAPFLRAEVSFIGSLLTRYFVNPARPPGMDYLTAEDTGLENQWQIFIDTEAVDLDLFDFADIAGDLLEAALDAAINTLLGPLPGWAKDLVKAIFGPLIDLVRAVLDLPDDIDEWLSDLFGVSLGLIDLIAQVLLDFFARENPINVIEDPFPILPAAGGLIPVKVPLTDFTVRVTDDEMIVEANVG